MCLVPPPQVVDGVHYTENIVYAAFIEAATSILSDKPSPTPPQPPPPLPPPAPQQPHWLLQYEIGGGACGFRAIPRHIIGNPEFHHQIRHQVVQYMSDNRNNSDLRIYEGINLEFLYCSGVQPSSYHSNDDHHAKMSSPYNSMGQPEIIAVFALYGKKIHVHFNDTTLPPPHYAATDEIHLRYTQMSRHYDTFQLTVPTPFRQPNPPFSGGGLSAPSS